MDQAQADKFAEDWVAAWNRRDIEAVLEHCSDQIVFHSPRIALTMGEGKIHVEGKDELRAYWTRALHLAPDLHFELRSVILGSSAITLLYRNQRSQNVSETLVFGEDGRVIRGVALYA